ncbi:MAG TPA: 3-oxoadipate enol-lactonase [Pseudonocardiaceae bacterium]|jgi:3-oxoadipate enol-lactonase|nr:3-oxoadipate enol-lactonase [Pseudonocardiaceae bacterium]
MTLNTDRTPATGADDLPILVVGPSLGTTLHMWDPQLDALAEQFCVLRYDHLGHGGSTVPPGPYTVDQLADEVLALVSTVNRFYYLGLSLGGMVGMVIAARHPERVERLALMCTSAHLPPESGWRDRAATVRAHGTASITEAALGRWFTPAFTDTEPYAAMLAATPDEGYAGCCEAIAAMDLRSRLPAITAPTLVIAGAQDPATPPEHGRFIADTIPDARLAVLPDASHLANAERPAEVTGLLVEHLAGGVA